MVQIRGQGIATRLPEFEELQTAAAAVLAACRQAQPWPPAALSRLIESGSPVLFSRVIEPLCDAFEPVLCDAYADLFSAVVEQAGTGLEAAGLRTRYESIRRPQAFKGPEPNGVYVLSRVTLGADIAVTSVMLDAAKRRFPHARIYFVGPPKNYELFNADPRIEHFAAPYGRTASLLDRLQAGLALRDLIPASGLIIDPDSRLSQLGILPLSADPSRHLFFESRSAGGESASISMTELARQWAARVLGVPDATNYAATRTPAAREDPGMIAVSLGVGENPAKRFPDPFESELIKVLTDTGRPILVDLGAGGEEEERVRKAIEANQPSSGLVNVWKGSFAAFASSIAASDLYVGYDSSGQHAAAAFGVPRLTLFAGFPNERFLARWQPVGSGTSLAIRAGQPDAIAPARAAIRQLLKSR